MATSKEDLGLQEGSLKRKAEQGDDLNPPVAKAIATNDSKSVIETQSSTSTISPNQTTSQVPSTEISDASLATKSDSQAEDHTTDNREKMQ